MKIKVFIFNAYDYGSTGKLCGYLKDGLNKYDATKFSSPLFFISSKKTNQFSDYSLFENRHKIIRYIIYMYKHRNKGYGFIDYKLTYRLTETKILQFINSYKIIFNVHNIVSSNFDLAALVDLSNKYHIPLVCTLHDCSFFTGKCPYYDLSNCQKWVNGCKGKCPDYLNYPKSSIKKPEKFFSYKFKIIHKAKLLTLVTPSLWLKKEVLKSQYRSTPVFVINNGIDTNIFQAPQTEDSNHAFVNILCAAMPWTERKGLGFINQLAERLDSRRYHIKLIGSVDNQLIHNKVEVIQQCKQAEMISYYQNADLFLNPTLEDNFPTVNIEALACGLPVITFNTGGSGEAVDDNTGYVCKQKTIDELLKGIHYLSSIDNIEQRCRMRALKYFDKSIFVANYAKLFLKLVK